MVFLKSLFYTSFPWTLKLLKKSCLNKSPTVCGQTIILGDFSCILRVPLEKFFSSCTTAPMSGLSGRDFLQWWSFLHISGSDIDYFESVFFTYIKASPLTQSFALLFWIASSYSCSSENALMHFQISASWFHHQHQPRCKHETCTVYILCKTKNKIYLMSRSK